MTRSKTASGAAVPALDRSYTALLGSGSVLGLAPLTLSQSAPLASVFERTAPPLPEPDLAPIMPEPPQQASLPLPPLPEPPIALRETPLPLPRPSDLQAPAGQEPPRIARPAITRRARAAAVAAVPEDNRSFFEKLFGMPRQPGTALAYAAPQDDVVDAGRGRRLSPSLVAPTIGASARTAIYDISARVVHMPNGERLEAHSGFGPKMDDPRFVHIRMHGATPPHVYDLTEREALFHGHRAVRLHPVGGSGAIFGRAGLLAHPYLLGPNGDSNGCVSIKDYEKFLQAFLRGEVKRLVVVARMG